MRIPNLNVSDSITRTIRDLDAQRLKLDKQISTGQKISLPEDDGLLMGRVIQLDTDKGKLAQYQRNASYATEFINAGHINLDKLRELNLRAQEIARVAGNNLSEPAIDGFSVETNQLIEEALIRINGAQRGRSLFGGTEVKPDFANTDVLLGELEKKILNLDENLLGREVSAGSRYLKQGDELSVTVNGREFVIQSKIVEEQEFASNNTYAKGDLVKVTRNLEDSIKTNVFEVQGKVGETNPSISELREDVLGQWSERDWSKEPVGKTSSGEDVYLLDLNQILKLAVDDLEQQPNIDKFPTSGGYYSLVEKSGVLYLEPVEEIIDKNSQASSYEFTSGLDISYWEASKDGLSGSPFEGVQAWSQISPYDRLSNLSTVRAVELIQEMVNQPLYLGFESIFSESDEYVAFSRNSPSSDSSKSSDSRVVAKITQDGSLELIGEVDQSFEISASYISRLDSENYFPNQLDKALQDKAKSLFPGIGFDELNQSQMDLVWGAVKDNKVKWDLAVQSLNELGNSSISIDHTKDWRRLEVYQRGDIIEHNGKLWESVQDENFNHLPDQLGSEFWKELGAGYSKSREDWTLTNTGFEDRFYYISPDGKLFEKKLEAENHTLNLLISSSNRTYTDSAKLFEDVDSLVQEVSYSVAKYEAQGSDSQGLVYFDPSSQSYRMGAHAEGTTAVSGTFVHGEVKNESDSLAIGDVVLKNGLYYQLIDQGSTLGTPMDAVSVSNLNESTELGEKVFVSRSNRLFTNLGDRIGTQGMEPILNENIGIPVRAGSYVYDRVNDEYYVASRDIVSATRSDLEYNFKFKGKNYVPEQDAQIITLSDEEGQTVQKGSIVKNSVTNEYFEALEFLDGVTNLDLAPKFVASNVHNSEQGSEWSANRVYSKGQIVLYRGVYYECQTDGIDGKGFNNEVADNSQLYSTEPPPLTVRPDEEFFLEASDTVSQEYLDLQKAKGEPVNNNVWLPVQESAQHIFSFTTSNNSQSVVKIHSAGTSGQDAQTNVITDANGKVTGIQVTHAGRYFFNLNSSDGSVPEEYEQADLLLPDGQSIRANIIWGENPNDPGPYTILGFELLGEAYLDEPTGAKKGDRFSFATGSKTFLEHRDSNGDVLSVTYTGSDANSEFYVGKDTKISSFLSAKDGNTAELADSVNSLIELRNGLKEDSPTELARRVQMVEAELILREDEVVDKIGELSSLLIRMDSVRAYDEDYHQQLEQRLAKDLDVDLSEAIMELTRVSTAYQAAMQVGAQLLNTSLLNYI